jgi:hypothetical protein
MQRINRFYTRQGRLIILAFFAVGIMAGLLVRPTRLDQDGQRFD